MSVGIPLIPYCPAVAGLSSTFNFTTVAVSLNCWATASTVGVNIRQGAHHSAQKSTNTGLPDFSTSCSKDPSLTSRSFSLIYCAPVQITCPYCPCPYLKLLSIGAC